MKNYSCTEKIRPRKSIRATALTETLLVFFPMIIFFTLTTWILYYWEGNHIDRSQKMCSVVAKQNVSFLTLDKGAKSNLCNPNYKKEYPWYYKDVTKDINGEAKDPTVYHVYISDYVSKNKFRKVMVGRGTSSWLFFPFLRGQTYFKSELKKRTKWFDENGNQKLNEKRKKLLLGS